MRRAGRPRKKASERRNKEIRVLVTNELKDLIRKSAAARGETVSAFLGAAAREIADARLEIEKANERVEKAERERDLARTRLEAERQRASDLFGETTAAARKVVESTRKTESHSARLAAVEAIVESLLANQPVSVRHGSWKLRHNAMNDRKS